MSLSFCLPSNVGEGYISFGLVSIGVGEKNYRNAIPSFHLTNLIYHWDKVKS